MILDVPLLIIHHYKVGNKGKGSSPGKGVASFPTPQ